MGRRDLTGGVLWWLTWKRWSLEGLESSKPLPAPSFPRLSFSATNFDLPRLKWKRSGNVRFLRSLELLRRSSVQLWCDLVCCLLLSRQEICFYSAWPWCFSRLAPLPASKNGSRSSDVEVWAACFPSHLLASPDKVGQNIMASIQSFHTAQWLSPLPYTTNQGLKQDTSLSYASTDGKVRCCCVHRTWCTQPKETLWKHILVVSTVVNPHIQANSNNRDNASRLVT